MKSTYLNEILFSTTVLRLDFTAITVQLTHGGACASHGNPDETCDLVELHPVVEFRRGIMRLPFAATTSRSHLSKV